MRWTKWTMKGRQMQIGDIVLLPSFRYPHQPSKNEIQIFSLKK